MPWTLTLLGTCELRTPDGRPVAFTTRKALALLAFVARQPERRVRRQRLLALLWEDVAQEQGRSSVRKALSIIRSDAGKVAPDADPPVSAEDDWVVVSDGLLMSDVDELLSAVAAAGNDPEALDAACNRYTGDFLGDFSVRNAPAFDDWVAGERQRLREVAIGAMRRLLQLLIQRPGSTDAALRVTLRVLALDPLQEDAHRSLMRLHVRQGRPAAALSHYHGLKDMLRRELGVDPEPETQSLFRDISAGRRSTGRGRDIPPAPSTPPLIQTSEAVEAAEPTQLRTVAVRGEPTAKRGLIAAAVLAVLLLIGAAVSNLASVEAPQVKRVFPIPTNLVMSGRPALSPDGSRLVFTAREDGSSNVDLYLTTIGDPQPLRLTQDAAIDDNAAWSPDATSIAFVRVARGGEAPCQVFVKTVPGGSERFAGRCRTSPNTSLAWSADGREIIFSDQPNSDSPHQIRAMDIRTGQTVTLTNPPQASFGDRDPALSRDGRYMAFLRDFAGRSTDLYLMDLSSGRLSKLTSDGGLMSGLAWDAADDGLFYSSDRAGDAGLWWLSRKGGEPQRMSAGLLDFRQISHARDRRLMVFEAIRDRSQLSVLGPATSEPASIPQLRSDARDTFPDVARDGTVAFVSTRSGQEQLWLSKPDSSPRQLSQFDGWRLSDVRWSPDGQHLAFVASRQGSTDIYLMSRDGGPPTQLTSDAAEDAAPGWSADGRRIYFASRRDGRSRIWLLNVFEGNKKPEPVSPPGPGDLRVDPKGRWLFYLYPGREGIWRRALTSDGARLVGPEQRLVHDFAPLDWMNWTVSPDAIFYASRPAAVGAGAVKRFDLTSGRTSVFGDASRLHRQSGFAVLPDGRLIAAVRTIEIDLFGMEFKP